MCGHATEALPRGFEGGTVVPSSSHVGRLGWEWPTRKGAAQAHPKWFEGVTVVPKSLPCGFEDGTVAPVAPRKPNRSG